jgi:hypothetical protein
MKPRKLCVNLLFCALLVLALVLTTVACTKQTTPTKEITGTVEQTDKGVVITSEGEGGQYLVAGQDLSAMVGKKVKASGTVTEAEGRKTINVTSVTEEKEASMSSEMQQEITGTVEKTDAGLIIKAGEADYLVAGQDLSAMLGKRVKATGTVAEAQGQKTLTVTSCTEMP